MSDAIRPSPGVTVPGDRAPRPPASPGLKYAPSLVTFVDLLGFSDLVRRRSAGQIADVLSRFARHSAPSFQSEADVVTCVAFSDTVVRVAAVSSSSDPGAVRAALLTEVSDVAAAQMLLSQRGIFIRGAIAPGDMYVGQGQLFGPGLVSAYMLESKQAVFPRVVLDEELVRLSGLRELFLAPDPDLSDYEPELVELGSYCKRDRDGLVFVDYLGALCALGDDSTADARAEREILEQKHGDAVRRGLASSDSGTLGKYLWLQGYHNNFVGDQSPAFVR